uniref:Aspartate dehydrogenase domain-containing protein n=1 Tax=Rhabditophanes sp. KR3021 TaxID=114890 RepID=A0AC35UA71_9BILA
MTITKVGIIGYGHLGKFLEEHLKKDSNFEIVNIWNRTTTPNILPLEEITAENLVGIDLIVEVCHPDITKKYGQTILKSCNLFIGSPTALADRDTEEMIRHSASINSKSVFVPTGALWAAEDITKMAELGQLQQLTITMTKHPSSFKVLGSLKPIVEEALAKNAYTVLFEGSVRDLCPLAPNNVNTMAGAVLAAHNLGFDKVKGKLIADPAMTDWHIVEIEAIGEGGFKVYVKRENPAKPGAVTGRVFLNALN